ncbi:hypothetical protein BU24DRAFT_467844 [Aaosphaeria arxii CBS 175.79]|uniref:BZIP domain-containing protein n=1 Tax=Aaosphaeria arxii CBS 175.79 TaxID=1450172 RepID=A0A6A5X994_9PLEO|nr:uncharacterized protein BU24DRAFT_467844 [Aaosphaeria arxii CBS 175.79]KAF2009469.1 hypothetical protein BU24DRAFT_467844 [Aaosphaeria arxii CBS 175.79]
MSANKASTASATRTKAINLERIRNNQRRCRARQKEYIAELEDKIRQYETANSQSSTDPRLQLLSRENESLKRLLQSLGLGNDFIKAYSKAAQIASDIPWAQAGNETLCEPKAYSSSSLDLEMLQSELTLPATHERQIAHEHVLPSGDSEASIDALQHFESSTQVDVAQSWEPFDFPNTSSSVWESLPTDIEVADSIQSTMNTLGAEASSLVISTEDISNTTTLCSSAFSLVLKNNLKGYSIADLDLKLRVGYKFCALSPQHCRIDNKILISVLAEIS